jgi:hypothetical protein
MEEARFGRFPSAVSAHVFVLLNLRHEGAEMRRVVNWCSRQFDDPNPDRWEQITDMIRFKRDDDALAFRLRWC